MALEEQTQIEQWRGQVLPMLEQQCNEQPTDAPHYHRGRDGLSRTERAPTQYAPAAVTHFPREDTSQSWSAALVTLPVGRERKRRCPGACRRWQALQVVDY